VFSDGNRENTRINDHPQSPLLFNLNAI
jgi:hypothetical protein